MAEVNVENMEDNAALFQEKMGFAHNEAGLDLTDDQLVNFLLLCHQEMMLPEEEEMMKNLAGQRDPQFAGNDIIENNGIEYIEFGGDFYKL